MVKQPSARERRQRIARPVLFEMIDTWLHQPPGLLGPEDGNLIGQAFGVGFNDLSPRRV
jgi:hypothetical protein